MKVIGTHRRNVIGAAIAFVLLTTANLAAVQVFADTVHLFAGVPVSSGSLIGVSLLATALTLLLAYGVWLVIKMRRELQVRRYAHSEALSQAHHDPLTGLPNRRRLLDVFTQLTDDLEPGTCRAIMMLDVDGFKPINDVYGHAFGDSLLRCFAERLADTVGSDGLVARLGGDEFAIVTPVLPDKEAAASLARRLVTRVEEPFAIGERQVSIGTGVGIALFPEDGHSMTELLRRADIALYRAKSAGRSTFRFFEVDMDATILHRTLLEQRLRRAVRDRKVSVNFQPIMDLGNGTIAGFEALARWKDEDFGQVSPTQFVPIAEDCGLISELTRYLLLEAATVFARLPDPLFLSFNLSPVQLQHQGLPGEILSVLQQANLPPRRLVLEITETSLVKTPALARTILKDLTDAGISIALDDFGAGHSSLSYLRDFPINKVKIDKSFIARMLDDKQCAAIVEAILVLSRGLDIEAVAEGIEDPDVRDALNLRGCHFGQGYLFAKAVPAEEASGLLDRTRRRGDRDEDLDSVA